MSDLLWWIVQPSGLAAAALAAAWLLLVAGARAAALALLTLVLGGVAVLAFVPVARLAAAPLEARHPAPDRLPPDVDGILVLGGSVDWRVSTARERLALGAAGERMLAAAALARRYPDAELVFTGLGREALARDFVAAPGAGSLVFGPEYAGRSPVFLSASSSTYEDALLAIERLEPAAGRTWLLVTSAWHMPRAWATFRTLGWTTVPYPVDFVTTGEGAAAGGLEGLGDRLARLDRIVREWGAILVYRRTGRIDDAVWRQVPAAGAEVRALRPAPGPAAPP